MTTKAKQKPFDSFLNGLECRTGIDRSKYPARGPSVGLLAHPTQGSQKRLKYLKDDKGSWQVKFRADAKTHHFHRLLVVFSEVELIDHKSIIRNTERIFEKWAKDYQFIKSEPVYLLHRSHEIQREEMGCDFVVFGIRHELGGDELVDQLKFIIEQIPEVHEANFQLI